MLGVVVQRLYSRIGEAEAGKSAWSIQGIPGRLYKWKHCLDRKVKKNKKGLKMGEHKKENLVFQKLFWVVEKGFPPTIVVHTLTPVLRDRGRWIFERPELPNETMLTTKQDKQSKISTNLCNGNSFGTSTQSSGRFWKDRHLTIT